MTQQTQPPRPDPIGDFQRWLMKSGAKGLGREVRGNLRKTFGRPSGEDVWSQATREDPDEPPECEWCPICRAARKYRDSTGPGVGGHLTGAGDAFASVVSDAFSAFESALSVVRPPAAPSGKPAPARPSPAPEPEPAAAAGPAAVAGPAGAPDEEPAAVGPAGAEPDAWDLAIGDGQEEPSDDPDHRG
jgi:hypothetical protein